MQQPQQTQPLPVRPPLGLHRAYAGQNAWRLIVTPDMAADWLVYNVCNRRFDLSKRNEYAHDMRMGAWPLNGETIKFDMFWRLLDGQHRLSACVLTQQPFETIVVVDLTAEAAPTIDRGKKRSIANVLQINGEKYASVLASALVWLHKFEHGEEHKQTSSMTLADAERRLQQHPSLRNTFNVIAPAAARGRLIDMGLLWALGYTFETIDQVDAARFFDKLGTGAGLGVDDPILALRTWLIADRNRPNGRRSYPYIVAATTIKAWNFFRDGAPCKQLRYRSGGAKPESFPKPH